MEIRKALLIILIFYFFIIVSLIFSYDFNKSFLPSFFYFRYFFLSLAIFFFLYKFEFSKKLILYSLLFLLALVIVHSIFEFMKIKNIFGLSLPHYRVNTDQALFFN